MSVRPFVEDDIPQVADLSWTFLHRRKGNAPAALRYFLKELYFTNPWIDSRFPSLVYENGSRKIVGFLGVIPRKMSLRGQPIRAAFGGNFVVHPEARSTLAGVRLLGAYVAGEQDLSQTDSANEVSRTLLKRLGFSTILPFSIRWVRPLRPARYGVYEISRLTRPTVSACLTSAARPFCGLVDSLATRLASSPFRQSESHLQAAELDLETLFGCLAQFRSGYSLWPDYDISSLNWLLTFMERMKARGTLRKVILRDDRQKLLGWYIYYLRPGAVSEVVQIGGVPESTKDILDHLFYDAWSRGAIALHGSVNSRCMGDFSEKNCVFTCRGGWMLAHSRRPELLGLLNSGDAFLSRLDGEWCLGFGE